MCGPASGSPTVVVVQSTHDGKSDHLLACVVRGESRSARFWYLLLHPLVWPCLVEVDHIGMEHALKLLLLQDEQVVQTFLTNATQETLTDGIGSWRMNGRFEHLNACTGYF